MKAPEHKIAFWDAEEQDEEPADDVEPAWDEEGACRRDGPNVGRGRRSFCQLGLHSHHHRKLNHKLLCFDIGLRNGG